MRVPLLLLPFLAACQHGPIESASGAGECRVTAPAQALVGKKATDALIADARRLSGARTLRRIGPDTVVTMDYRTDRLNIYVDAQGTIDRLSCG